MTELTQESLKEILHYNPGTGVFTWKKTNRPGFVGRVGGTITNKGYVLITIFGKMYRAHRLAFLYIIGAWPNETVDHINRIKHDNRWCNLRACSHSDNVKNQSKRPNNKSGFKGVHWRKDVNKWWANISSGGKRKSLGLFDCRKTAALAYNNAALELHGEFAYLNDIPQ